MGNSLRKTEQSNPFLKFDNRFYKELPGNKDPLLKQSITPHVCYSEVKPVSVPNPKMLAWSKAAAQLIGLENRDPFDQEMALIFSGNQLPLHSNTYATRYGGHQFGHWAGQLGDGRVIALGECLGPDEKRKEIQLKGAGKTPYSRQGDGKAVLRSSLREFLCSEALFFLHVPTTRALCCVTTGEEILRDMFYDGNVKPEPGAITTRLAPTFLRFGHFEILAAQREKSLLRSLVEFVFRNYFTNEALDFQEKVTLWFEEICKTTAQLMVEWQKVGFVHGVMNTDNMSILGLTIDYGPYGFLDVYDPRWTPNTTDVYGRYSFGQQPSVALWNLYQFAQSLAVLLDNPKELEKGLYRFEQVFQAEFKKMMANKMGLEELKNETDKLLIQDLDKILQMEEMDMTLFYRNLAFLHQVDLKKMSLLEFFQKHLKGVFYSENPKEKTIQALIQWLERYLARCKQEKKSGKEITTLMNSVNPVFIPRNYLIQEILDELVLGNRKPLDDLMKAMEQPYIATKETLQFFKKRPSWAKNKPGCSALSCSS